jgi:hypothetical protein
MCRARTVNRFHTCAVMQRGNDPFAHPPSSPSNSFAMRSPKNQRRPPLITTAGTTGNELGHLLARHSPVRAILIVDSTTMTTMSQSPPHWHCLPFEYTTRIDDGVLHERQLVPDQVLSRRSVCPSARNGCSNDGLSSSFLLSSSRPKDRLIGPNEAGFWADC